MTISLDIEPGPWFSPSSATPITVLTNETKTETKTETKMKTPAKKKIKTMTAEQLIEARDRLHELNQQMEEAKTEQLAIREYIAKNLHEGDEGAKTVTIDGIKVTVTRNLNRTISREEAERFSQENPKLALEVLRWKPELRVGEVKKHEAEVSQFIVTKPGPPTVVFA